MDEAEKYQQRVQAIAEKRRLQEEQERVKREMEDERIRLQQLKRKSLRDQWLMEGPPLSPDSAGPRSPLWGQQAQEIEQNIDSLQAKTERLTEEVAKLSEDDGSVACVSDGLAHDNSEGTRIAEDGRTEPAAKEPVLQNGQGNGTTEVGAEEDGKATSVAPTMAEEKGPNGEVATDMPVPEADAVKPPTEIQNTLEEAAVMATSASLSASAAGGSGAQEVPPTSNGPISKPGDGNGAVTMTFLGFSDAEKGEGESVGEEDDGGAIMRAERVIIMDEGEEAEAAMEAEAEMKVEDEPQSHTAASEAPAAETSTAAENQEPEATEATEAEAQPATEAPAEAEKHVEAEVTEPADPAEPKAEAAEAVEAEESGEAGEMPGDVQAEPDTTEATEATADEVQSQPQPTEGAAAVSSEVPVYPPAALTAPAAPANEDESPPPDTHELKREEGGEEVALATDPTPAPAPASVPVPSSPSQFQDVPLDDGASKAPCPEPPGEQEPLLTSKTTAPPTDTSAPRRAEGVDAPKQKACQCCSVM